MNAFRTNVLLAALCAGCVLPESSALARLGETKDQIKTRFGDPIQKAASPELKQLKLEQWTYLNKDLLIGVTYAENKSVSEQYRRVKSLPKSNEEPVLLPIPDSLIKALLDAQAEGSEWIDLDKTANKHRYLRKDRMAVATVVLANGIAAEVRIGAYEFNQHLEKIAPKKGK